MLPGIARQPREKDDDRRGSLAELGAKLPTPLCAFDTAAGSKTLPAGIACRTGTSHAVEGICADRQGSERRRGEAAGRPREQVALAQVAAQRRDRVALGGGLDPLRDERDAEVAAQGD